MPRAGQSLQPGLGRSWADGVWCAGQVKIVKKDYTPFPPPQQPRKVDLQIESGEYFLSDEQKQSRRAPCWVLLFALAGPELSVI